MFAGGAHREEVALLVPLAVVVVPEAVDADRVRHGRHADRDRASEPWACGAGDDDDLCDDRRQAADAGGAEVLGEVEQGRATRLTAPTTNAACQI